VLAWAVPTATAQKDKDKDKASTTTFEIYQDGKKECAGATRRPTATSSPPPARAYKAKADAKKSVEALQDHADANKAEFYEGQEEGTPAGGSRRRTARSSRRVGGLQDQGRRGKRTRIADQRRQDGEGVEIKDKDK